MLIQAITKIPKIRMMDATMPSGPIRYPWSLDSFAPTLKSSKEQWLADRPKRSEEMGS
jgi:hypothetical protein